jgi:hypothetical protein
VRARLAGERLPEGGIGPSVDERIGEQSFPASILTDGFGVSRLLPVQRIRLLERWLAV